MQLSPHFSLAEFTVSQEAARRGIGNTPTEDVVDRLRHTAQCLESVRSLFGYPIIITSGFRCAKLNAAIGGAQNSAHMAGDAADFICPPAGNPATICGRIMASGIKFDQLILEGGWTHISFAPAMRQQILTATFTAAGPRYSIGIKGGQHGE